MKRTVVDGKPKIETGSFEPGKHLKPGKHFKNDRQHSDHPRPLVLQRLFHADRPEILLDRSERGRCHACQRMN
jgi:hypothetical protein